jgi:hypothetical protein
LHAERQQSGVIFHLPAHTSARRIKQSGRRVVRNGGANEHRRRHLQIRLPCINKTRRLSASINIDFAAFRSLPPHHHSLCARTRSIKFIRLSRSPATKCNHRHRHGALSARAIIPGGQIGCGNAQQRSDGMGCFFSIHLA